MTTTLCHCGDEPATAINSWIGEPIGEACLSINRSVKTDPLTSEDIANELKEAVTPDEPDDYRGTQNEAIGRLAGLLAYQQRRIANLEAAVAELIGRVP
ncbi:hypothetical protein [Streptomyces roseolus]|uniref:hypothetical protein n=1 Tax=Streptomyces roseolus TaxID=67358 RepID=UPI0037B5FE49